MVYLNILLRLLVVLSVFVFPWWLTAIFALVALFKFRFFIEVVVIGLLIDVIYGTHIIFESLPYMATLITLVVFIFVNSFKKRLMI